MNVPHENSPVVGTPRTRSGGGSSVLIRQMRRQLLTEKIINLIPQAGRVNSIRLRLHRTPERHKITQITLI